MSFYGEFFSGCFLLLVARIIVVFNGRCKRYNWASSIYKTGEGGDCLRFFDLERKGGR